MLAKGLEHGRQNLHHYDPTSRPVTYFQSTLQLEGRQMFSAESIAVIPSMEDLPTQTYLQEAIA